MTVMVITHRLTLLALLFFSSQGICSLTKDLPKHTSQCIKGLLTDIDRANVKDAESNTFREALWSEWFEGNDQVGIATRQYQSEKNRIVLIKGKDSVIRFLRDLNQVTRRIDQRFDGRPSATTYVTGGLSVVAGCSGMPFVATLLAGACGGSLTQVFIHTVAKRFTQVGRFLSFVNTVENSTHMLIDKLPARDAEAGLFLSRVMHFNEDEIAFFAVRNSPTGAELLLVFPRN